MCFRFITLHNRNTDVVHPLLVELVDLRHVSEEDVLLVKQCVGDEVRHGRIVHFCCITLNAKSFFKSNVKRDL